MPTSSYQCSLFSRGIDASALIKEPEDIVSYQQDGSEGIHENNDRTSGIPSASLSDSIDF